MRNMRYELFPSDMHFCAFQSLGNVAMSLMDVLLVHGDRAIPLVRMTSIKDESQVGPFLLQDRHLCSPHRQPAHAFKPDIEPLSGGVV
jgi:hypothetical protein